MKQDLVKKIPVLIPTAIKTIIGSTLHAATLHVLQGTPGNVSFDLNGLVNARDSYENAKLSLTVTRNTFVLKTQMTRETIRIARDIIKQYLGTEYNSKWDGLGMKDGSIAVPYTAEELYPVALGFKAHFAANPERENIPLQITAVKMQALYDELIAAQTAVLSEEEAVDELKIVRDEKTDRLFKRLRATIEELTLLMGPLDPRWKTFGFNMPGADETPDAPLNVLAVLIGATTAALKWAAAPRAEYYRVWVRVIGVDAEPITVGSPADIDFTLENLPAGSTIEIYVSAVNNGGESQLSEKITITTH
ncbi:MAG: hypothetical protein JWM68_1445 [Verrucomicrobiales bacterium]|nr:hypothetical protein [Verrucomicrobiales bacterium]